MTAKQFYNWQPCGGTDDVVKLVNCLEKADIARLVETHAELWQILPDVLKELVENQRINLESQTSCSSCLCVRYT